MTESESNHWPKLKTGMAWFFAVAGGIATVCNLGQNLVQGVRVLSLLADVYQLITHSILDGLTTVLGYLLVVDLDKTTFDAAFSVFIALYLCYALDGVLRPARAQSAKFRLKLLAWGAVISVTLALFLPNLGFGSAAVVYLVPWTILVTAGLAVDLIAFVHGRITKEEERGGLGSVTALLLFRPQALSVFLGLGLLLALPLGILVLNENADVSLPPIERFGAAVDKTIEDLLDGALRD